MNQLFLLTRPGELIVNQYSFQGINTTPSITISAKGEIIVRYSQLRESGTVLTYDQITGLLTYNIAIANQGTYIGSDTDILVVLYKQNPGQTSPTEVLNSNFVDYTTLNDIIKGTQLFIELQNTITALNLLFFVASPNN